MRDYRFEDIKILGWIKQNVAKWGSGKPVLPGAVCRPSGDSGGMRPGVCEARYIAGSGRIATDLPFATARYALERDCPLIGFWRFVIGE